MIITIPKQQHYIPEIDCTIKVGDYLIVYNDEVTKTVIHTSGKIKALYSDYMDVTWRTGITTPTSYTSILENKDWLEHKPNKKAKDALCKILNNLN